MKRIFAILLVAALGPGLAFGDMAPLTDFGALEGRVSSIDTGLAYTKVYAYHLSEQGLRKILTDEQGNFRFDRLPAGLYKVIAFKDGFIPAIALLTRSTSEAYQFLSMELVEEDAADSQAKSGFWAVRERIPSDVLRDLEVSEAGQDGVTASGVTATEIDKYHLEAKMRAIAGMNELPAVGSAAMAGGRVGIQGAINNLNVGLVGDFMTLQSRPGVEAAGELTSGRTQVVSLNVSNAGSTGLRVSTTNNYLSTGPNEKTDLDRMGLERHRVSWSQEVGLRGTSSFSAEYAEESNFFSQAPIELLGIPDASRFWGIEGSYSTLISDNHTVRTGFRYRERQSSFDSPLRLRRLNYSTAVPSERLEFFGQSGVKINPSVLVEFGLFSTLRDGSLSLSPTGTTALQLGERWRATASGTIRVHEDKGDTLHADFTPAMFGQYDPCRTAQEYCYKVTLARETANQEDFSFAFLHRRFAETLHLYFNEDFFNRLESLYLVRGDNLPELQFRATRRLAPEILATLSSNIAAGGGGILYTTDRSSYENEVRYLVTSLDTKFEQTSTGVFVAFHHVAQELDPIRDRHNSTPPEMQMERLQVLLTQDLDMLHSLVSDWAVHLHMEVSRGKGPESESLNDDELRRRLMGGVTVSF